MPLKQDQIDEWLEGEVTLHFLATLKRRLDVIHEQRSTVYFPFEAHKTQEVKAILIGAEGELQDIIDAMTEKDISQLEEVEDEQVGDSPSTGPGFN